MSLGALKAWNEESTLDEIVTKLVALTYPNTHTAVPHHLACLSTVGKIAIKISLDSQTVPLSVLFTHSVPESPMLFTYLPPLLCSFPAPSPQRLVWGDVLPAITFVARFPQRLVWDRLFFLCTTTAFLNFCSSRSTFDDSMSPPNLLRCRPNAGIARGSQWVRRASPRNGLRLFRGLKPWMGLIHDHLDVSAPVGTCLKVALPQVVAP